MSRLVKLGALAVLVVVIVMFGFITRPQPAESASVKPMQPIAKTPNCTVYRGSSMTDGYYYVAEGRSASAPCALAFRPTTG